MANAVVARLLAAGKVPGLEGAKITRAEVTVRHSRFDFLLEKDQRPFLLEVKSCSLFGRKTIAQEANDRGSCITMFSIAVDAIVAVGNLGKMSFQHGYYLYVDTAREELSKHIKRHLNHNKSAPGDIYHLRSCAVSCIAIPIRSSVPLEHEIAAAVEAIADATPPFSGSSDRLHANDLYYFADNPLHSPLFMKLLQYFRMDRLAKIL